MNLVFVANIADSLRKIFTHIGGAFLSIPIKLLYVFCTFIFSIMDMLQLLIRKVAGLDKVYYSAMDYGSTGPETGDIAYNIIQNIFLGENSILSTVFWSMIILGAILLFLTTLVAILRSEYATLDSKSSSKGKIIGQALKAIASFAVVPIVAVFGMYLSNVILQAIDGATSVSTATISTEQYFEPGELKDNSGDKTYTNYIFYGKFIIPTSGTPISGQIFSAAAYKANRIRFYTPFQVQVVAKDLGDGIFHNLSTDLEKAASLLDTAFANGYVVKNKIPKTLDGEVFEKDYLYPLVGNNFLSNNAPSSFVSFDKTNVSLVWYYYDLWSFDFIVCIGALVVAAKLLLDLVFGLMKRLFELVVLFLISAPLAALMPLDDGAALTGWRKKFVSKAIGTYAPVLGLNLLFLILPEFSKIKFFNIFVLDNIVNVLFIIVGLLMVKDLVSMVAELVGGDDALKAGEGMSGAVGGAAINIAKTAVAPAGMAAKLAKGGVKMAKGTAKGVRRGLQNRSDRKDKKAEEKYLKDGIENDVDLKKDFDNLNPEQQKETLTRLRLNMSEKDREKALTDGGRTRSVKSIMKAKDAAAQEEKSQAHFKQVNDNLFGAEGSQKRITHEKRIEQRRSEEDQKLAERNATKGDFTKGAKDILGALKDGLTTLTQHLGGEFAKAWKDGGGLGSVLQQSVGMNAKEQGDRKKDKDAVKEQKRLIEAQNKAQNIIGGGSAPKSSGSYSGSSGGGSVKLDTASIESLAQAIAEQVKK